MNDDTLNTIEPEATGFNRRRFLMGGVGVAGAAIVLAACGSDDEEPAASGDTTTSGSSEGGSEGGGGGGGGGDLAVAQAAAGLEVLAVGTYRAALEAATAGNLGEVPPAVAEYVGTALSHHEDHLAAWNKVITDAGESEVTEPNATLKPVVDEEFGKVTDVAGAAKLALMLEDIAAQTYLKALPTLESPEAIRLAGSIQGIDQMHQSILLYALGQYPVPETFQKTDKAAI